MRWDKGYQSPNIEDRRSSSPFGFGGGMPLGGLLAVASRFGIKGILIALLLVGLFTYGGVCGEGMSCLGGGGAPTQRVTSQSERAHAARDVAVRARAGE